VERKSGGYCPSVRATRDGAILYAVPNDRSLEFRPSPLRMAQVGRLSGWGSSQLRSGHHQPIQQGPAWFKKAHPSLLPGSWISPAPSTGQPASALGCQFKVARHLAQDRISGAPIGIWVLPLPPELGQELRTRLTARPTLRPVRLRHVPIW
jgi:hypothetical protein